jgi:uncharacterized protein (TIGR02145 family)
MKNKLLLTLFAIIIFISQAMAQIKQTFKDPRDGRKYKTVIIGTQTWMAENLAFKADSGCWAYDNNPDNVETYGYLYDWETAINVCPPGWHLPDNEEWARLICYFGGTKVAANKLKSSKGWGNNNSSSNSSGFSALPGGNWDANSKNFDLMGESGFWWSSSWGSAGCHPPSSCAWALSMLSEWSNVVSDDEFSKKNGLSIRCVMDEHPMNGYPGNE